MSDNDQRFVRVFANIGNPVEQYFYRKLHLFLRLALKSLSHIYHESFDSDGIVLERQTLMLIERCIENERIGHFPILHEMSVQEITFIRF